MSVEDATAALEALGLEHRRRADRALRRAQPGRPAERRRRRPRPQGQHGHRLHRLMAAPTAGRAAPRTTGCSPRSPCSSSPRAGARRSSSSRTCSTGCRCWTSSRSGSPSRRVRCSCSFPQALGRASPAGAHGRRSSSALLYGVAQILQTAGLAHTPASVSGFITGMYVVCTPLLAAPLLHQRIGADHLGRGAARRRRAGGAHAERPQRSGTARR